MGIKRLENSHDESIQKYLRKNSQFFNSEKHIEISESSLMSYLNIILTILLTHIGKLSGNDSGDFPETFSKKIFLPYYDVTTDDN